MQFIMKLQPNYKWLVIPAQLYLYLNGGAINQPTFWCLMCRYTLDKNIKRAAKYDSFRTCINRHVF